MVESIVGTPVRKENFYGREKFVQLVADKLKVGHVLLAAPRRFGKTSVMYSLADNPRWNYQIIHTDLERFSEPSELVAHLIEKLATDSKLSKILNGLSWLPNKVWTGFKDNIEELELVKLKIKLKEDLRPEWQERGEELFKLVAKSSETIVFVLDELPMMIDRMARSGKKQEAVLLLRWLRAMRQSPQTEKVRFLIAGSIGIDQVLKQLGETKSINDFEKMKLEPFPQKVAKDFLYELAKTHEINLTPACKNKMIELVGVCVPYFLQILFSEVYKTHVQDDEAITPKKIENIYRNKILGVDCKTYFEHYYGRLRDYYKPHEEKATKRILRELAFVETMTRDACWQFFKEIVGKNADVENFNSLMTDLENDFYVSFDTEKRRYEFSCKLLRDWWLRHYGMETSV